MSLHDAPDLAELVAAVREFVESDVMSATEGRVRFHARVAANLLAMVERELALGPGQAAAHAEGLGRLGISDEAALAATIRERAGDVGEEVGRFVRDTVRMKLEVANPSYLRAPSSPAEPGSVAPGSPDHSRLRGQS